MINIDKKKGTAGSYCRGIVVIIMLIKKLWRILLYFLKLFYLYTEGSLHYGSKVRFMSFQMLFRVFL